MTCFKTREICVVLFFIMTFLLTLTKTDESAGEVTIMSEDRLNEVIGFIREIKLHQHLLDITVRYVMIFENEGKMSMKTTFGKKTIPVSEAIKRNLTIMIEHSIHLELTRVATEKRKFDYGDPINVYQYIRNNTIILDKIIDHMNGSFNKHHEVENPAKIEAYNKLRNEDRFFRIHELENARRVLLNEHFKSNLTVRDFVLGKLRGNLTQLKPEECSDLGDFVYNQNISHSVLFYERALRRFHDRNYFHYLTNKTQLLNKMIDLFSPYGEICQKKVEELKELKLEQIEKDLADMKKTIKDVRHGVDETDDENDGIDEETETEEEEIDEEFETCVRHIINQSIENDESHHDEL